MHKTWMGPCKGAVQWWWRCGCHRGSHCIVPRRSSRSAARRCWFLGQRPRTPTGPTHPLATGNLHKDLDTEDMPCTYLHQIHTCRQERLEAVHVAAVSFRRQQVAYRGMTAVYRRQRTGQMVFEGESLGLQTTTVSRLAKGMVVTHHTRHKWA